MQLILFPTARVIKIKRLIEILEKMNGIQRPKMNADIIDLKKVRNANSYKIPKTGCNHPTWKRRN